MNKCDTAVESGGAPASRYARGLLALAVLAGFVCLSLLSGISAGGVAHAAGDRTGAAAPQLAQGAGVTDERAFLVQLASVTSAQEAERQWGQLKESFPDLLGGSQLLIEKVELSGRGIFHRVQTGPFPDLRMAEKLCAAFKQRAQDCLVVQTSMSYPPPPAMPSGRVETPAARRDAAENSVEGSEELFEQFLQWRKQKEGAPAGQ